MNFYDLLFEDEGKKGMKRGQHVMARDPEYLRGIKGGGFRGASRATFLGSVKGQGQRLSKSYDKIVNRAMENNTEKDWNRLERAKNNSVYNKIGASNKLQNQVARKQALVKEARAASSASRNAGHNIISAKTRVGSGIKVNVPEGIKVKKFLPRNAKLGLAGTGVAAALGGAGYLAHKLRGKDSANTLKHRKMDLSIPAKANLALGAALLSAPIAILIDRLILTPIWHHFDIQDIYEGKWSEKDFVGYIKDQYRRKSDKFWRNIVEPGIEPRSFNESDYQKTKQLVMNAKSAKDLSRIFPNNKFLKNAAKAFEFVKQTKRRDEMSRRTDSMIIRKINYLKARRHSDALKIRRLKRHLDLNFALAVGGGLLGGGTLGVLFGRYVIHPLANKMNIKMIYDGDYPEELFLNTFKTYFKSGTSVMKRFVEPEIWDEISNNNFESFRSKVMSARKVSDLVKLFPNSKFLADVNAAYRQARASGIY